MPAEHESMPDHARQRDADANRNSARRVILVVPCFNEAVRLDSDAFSSALVRMEWLDLIFVNDGSTDDTAGVLERLRVRHPERVRVLDLPHNLGKAEAVRRGLQRANEAAVADRAEAGAPVTLCGFWDADLSAPLDELRGMRRVFTEHPHVEWVWGVRLRSLGRQVTRHASRHYLGRVFATVASVVVSLPIYDSQCGAKLFRSGELLAAVISTPFASRWIFDVELVARGARVCGRDQLSRLVREHPLD